MWRQGRHWGELPQAKEHREPHSTSMTPQLRAPLTLSESWRQRQALKTPWQPSELASHGAGRARCFLLGTGTYGGQLSVGRPSATTDCPEGVTVLHGPRPFRPVQSSLYE